MKYKPPRETCEYCNGKKWFMSAIGEIACQRCNGSGKGDIDVDAVVKDWQRLKGMERSMKADIAIMDEALNTGDGTYKP